MSDGDSDGRYGPLVSEIADELARSLGVAALDLARLLDRQDVSYLHDIPALSEKLDGLSEKLDRTNELLNNMLKVLSSAR